MLIVPLECVDGGRYKVEDWIGLKCYECYVVTYQTSLYFVWKVLASEAKRSEANPTEKHERNITDTTHHTLHTTQYFQTLSINSPSGSERVSIQ